MVYQRLILCLILGLSLFLVGCGDGFKAFNPSSAGDKGPNLDSNQCPGVAKAQAALESPFKYQKVQVASLAPGAGFSKASSAVWTGSIDVMVDGDCLESNGDKKMFLGTDLEAENSLGLKTLFAVSIALSEQPDMEDLEVAAESNSCIMGVADSGVAQAGQVFASQANDPDIIGEQTHLNLLNYETSFDYFYGSGRITSNTIVAVVDTGVDFNHPDLSCNMWPGAGIDVVNNDNDPMDDDPGGHGTHVAGLIGACGNNGIGGSGIMADGVQLMGVKVLAANGSGSIQQVVNGILFAIENGADVINLSLEAAGFFPQMRAALQTAVNNGVVVVVAAGNSTLRIDNLNAAAAVSPAIDSDIPGLITVGSIDVADAQPSAFSNFSPDFVEIAATGSTNFEARQGIYSTRLGGGYQRISGTSQATPLVAGAMGLLIGSMKSRGVAYTPASLETYLLTKGTRSDNLLSGFFANGSVLDLGVLATSVAIDSGDSLVSPEDASGDPCL